MSWCYSVDSLMRYIVDATFSLLFRLRAKKIAGLVIKGRVTIRGNPIIQLRKGARVEVHDDVTLNSRNRGYHVNMFAPVKLLADREGAEIVIGSNTRIHGSCIHAWCSVRIGKNCLVAANCQILDSSGHDISMSNPELRLTKKDKPKPVVIEDNVWLGTGVIVLPGVSIGEGSVIAAGSVVSKSVPAYSIVAGNPGVVVRQYSKKKLDQKSE